MSTVYVLGAGASRAVIPAAPLNDALLPEALRVLKEQVRRVRSDKAARAARLARIECFINDFYLGHAADTPIEPSRLPRVEDLLSQLDLAIQEGRPLSSRYDVAFLRLLRDDLVYGFGEALRDTLKREFDVQLMWDFVGTLDPGDSIVSLNYDLIADNAILWRYGRVDYGLPIRYARRPRKQPVAYGSPQGPRPPLYKLHGSLNWVYCPLCQHLDVTELEKGMRRIFDDRTGFLCPDCDGRYEPLIITPTLLKTYANGLLLDVWRRAEDKISRADEVVFLGYSLADADVHLRCMIKRAMYANGNRRLREGQPPHRCSVRVVGNSPAGSATHQRFERVFGEVAYDGEGFESIVRERLANSANRRRRT